MNKEELQALGLTDEQAEKVLAEITVLQKTLKERDKQLESLKKASGDNAELQKSRIERDSLRSQIQTLQQQNAEQQKAHKAELQQLKLDNAIDNTLTAAGARNNKAVRALLDLTNVQLGEDGRLAGWQEQLEALQKSDGYLFAAQQQQATFRGFQPAAGSGGVPQGQADTRKMSYDELCAYVQQNPGAELK